MRFPSILSATLFLSLAIPAAGQPPAVRVAKAVRTEVSSGEPAPLPQLLVGRFYPIELTAASPALFDADEKLVRVVMLKPGERLFNQVIFDAPAGTTPGDYEFPDAKAGVAIVFPRATAGNVTVKSYVNGAGTGPPVRSSSVMLEIVVEPRPPPVDPVDPILTPFQMKLQTAFRADGATVIAKSRYAALWRNAAKTTVYDAGLATPAALLAELKTAVTLLGIPHGSLDRTAREVADELNPLMPKPANGTMDKTVRDNVSALFARIAQDLEVIK